MTAPPAVSIKNLRIALPKGAERPFAVDGVSLALRPGKIVCVVGESGSGKSMCAHALMGLLPDTVTVTSGEIQFEGRDLLKLDDDGWRDLRGRRLAMIFQEPMTALNPLMRIGDQMAEMFEAHGLLTPKERRAKALSLAREVGLPDPERIVRAYPHQLSGGQRQRAMIAMALALEPAVLVADEPTTALDVTIQAQILDLLQDMKERFGMAVMLITHAMGVVAETAQRVVVMYAGKVVEEALVDDLFGNPGHPYTQGLIRSIPRIDLDSEHKTRLEAIGGSVPILINPPVGCRFAPRCKFAMNVCTEKEPLLREIAPGHRMACHLGDTQLGGTA